MSITPNPNKERLATHFHGSFTKIKNKRDEQTYQWWFLNYCSESNFKSPWICLLRFPSASNSLLQVISQKNDSKLYLYYFWNLELAERAPARHGELTFLHQRVTATSWVSLNRLHSPWRVVTRPGELLLALASVSDIKFDALCLYSPCTRSELALAS